MKMPSVYLCPTKAGHWKFDSQVSVRGVRRHLQSGYVYSSASEAAKALKSKKIALLAQRDGKRSDPFSTLTFRYYESLRERMKPTSYWETYLLIEKNLRKPFDQLSVALAFSEENLHAFRENLYLSKKSEKTKNRILHQFLAMALFGNDHEILADFELKRAKASLTPFHGGEDIKEPRRAMSVEEYRCFMKAFRKDDKRKVLFQFLFATGCRIGEAAAVQIRDFNPAKNTVQINKTVAYKTEKGAPLTQSPKTPAGNRIVLLSEKMSGILKAYLKTLSPANPASFLFFGSKKPLSLSNVRRAMNDALDKAGLQHYVIHEIRHSVTTWGVNAMKTPAGIHVVSQRLGRACDSVTMDVYYHGDEKAEKQLIKKMPI
jgi:integrase